MGEELAAEIRTAQAARDNLRTNGIKVSWDNALVVHRARSRGLDVSADDRGRVLIKGGRRSRWFAAGNVSINRQLAKRSVQLGNVTNALLRARDVRVPQKALFEAGEADRAWGWAQAVLPVVLRPNDTGQEVLVRAGIEDREAFDAAFEAIENAFDQVLVEQSLAGIEHRVLVIDNEIIAATRRLPAHVVGDGRSAVSTLVQVKNAARAETKNPLHHDLKLDAAAERELARQDLTDESVPAADQIVYLRPPSTFDGGGDTVDTTDDLSEAEQEFVRGAARVFTGLRLGGFDILLPRDGAGTEPAVLRIDGSPSIAMHHFPSVGRPRDAAGALMDAMFPANARQ